MPETSPTAHPDDAPLFGWRGCPVAALVALVLCWPMLVTGQNFVFPDTSSYLRGGEAISDVLRAALRDVLDLFRPQGSPDGGGPSGGAVTALTVSDRGEPVTGRSFTYSTAAYLTYLFGGPMLFAYIQTFLTVLAGFALISRKALAKPAWLLGGGAVLAVASTLPFFSIYLIPDIMAAVVVIYGLVLVGRLDHLTGWQIAGATALTAIAVSTHYGYMPLIAIVVAAALLWRLAAGHLRAAVVAIALVPVLAAPLANITASRVVLNDASVAPRRLPILLARSIQDGPAAWYLQNACPEADLAFCEAFGDDVPTNIKAFLWDLDGITSLTPQQLENIRAEESLVLMRAFRDYPLQQSASLLGNWGRQIVMIGTEEFIVTDGFRPNWGFPIAGPETFAMRLVGLADVVTPPVTWAGAAVLLALILSGRLDRPQTGMVVLLAVGLLGNAAIFGGLSAPVERYQSRIAWLMPFLAILLVCELARREPAGPRAGRR